jgi:DNA-binding response OmpR family regulator
VYRGSIPPAHLRAQISTADVPLPTLVISNGQPMSLEQLQAMAAHLAERLRLVNLPVTTPPVPEPPTHCPHCQLRIKDEVDVVEADGFRFNLRTGMLAYGDIIMRVTQCQAYVLRTLMENRNRMSTREILWLNSKGPGIEPDTEPKIIDVFICKLRRKIRDATGLEPIQTEWGRGFYWRLPQ